MKNKEKKIKHFSSQEGLDRVSNSSNFSWNQQTNSSSKSTTKKHVLSGVLAFFVCFAVFAAVVFPLSSTSTDNTILGTAPEDLNDSWILEENRGTSFAGGTGTQDDPFQIKTAEQLAYLSYLVYLGTTDSRYSQYISGDYYFTGAYFKQTANIDLSAHYWQPIGIYHDREGNFVANYFSGNYDGTGYTISGVKTPAGYDSAYSNQGLFGYVRGQNFDNMATIKNVGVIDSNVRGNQYVGGIVGYAGSYTTIENSYNTGSIFGKSSYVGGIVGNCNSSSILNCYNTGSVTSDGSLVGGIAGAGDPRNSYNLGPVIGRGINGSVGGISGNGTPINCFNIGSVTSTSSTATNVGGVSGSGSPINCYYGGDCGNIGGASGSDTTGAVYSATLTTDAKTESWFTNADNWATGYGVWDFSIRWGLDASINDGYPYFSANWWLAKSEYYDTIWEGSGTEEDPYLISTAAELAGLSYMVYYGAGPLTNTYYYYADTYFKQTADIDLSEHIWQPIGVVYDRDGNRADHRFSGHYDGNGYTISGVNTPLGYNTNAYYGQGLFGYVDGFDYNNTATITNVGVIDSNIQGYVSVGGIVGRAYQATISNCYYTGTVVGSGSNVGGIVGNMPSGNIINTYNTGSVTGAGDYVGGISGYGSPWNSFNVGSVSGTGSYVGGVTGNGSPNNSYYGGNCGNIGGVNGADTAEAVYSATLATDAKTESWFTNPSNWDMTYGMWDLATIWKLDGVTNDGYPYLDPMEGWLDSSDYYDIIWQGSGTAEDPFLIEDAADLAGLSYVVYYGDERYNQYVSGYNYFANVYFKQTENIDLSGRYWQPIGVSSYSNGVSLYHYFAGNYDGDNHTISGLVTRMESSNSSSVNNYRGLFGIVSASSSNPVEIKNLGVIDSFIQGSSQVGAILGGYNNSSNYITISNCYSTSTVVGSTHVGGIIGYGGNVFDSYNTGSVSGQNNVGGIAGNSSSISNSHNIGNVSGQNYIGGIVGQGSSDGVSNSYNAGNVSGTERVGGIAGGGASVSNSYNTGTVSGTSYVGGLVGSGRNILMSYNTANVTATGDRVGGLAGDADLAFNSYNIGNVSGANYVGGLGGNVDMAMNAFNVGSVAGTGSNVGGLIGSGSASYAYYGGSCGNIGAVSGSDTDTAYYLSNLESLAKTLSWYQTSSNWRTDWDFETIWKLSADENQGYPTLTGESAPNWLSDPDFYDTEWEGSGTEADPFLISSAEELAGLSYMIKTGGTDYVINEMMGAYCYYSGVYFKQTANIDLSAHYWEPIGGMNDSGDMAAFGGVFDGNGFTISGLNCFGGVGSSNPMQALFGMVSGSSDTNLAVLKNINLANSLIMAFGDYMPAGLSVYTVYAQIDNCANGASVMGAMAGGITTMAMFSTISNSYNYGTLTGMGEGMLGGIVAGSTMDVTITNCYNLGTLTGTTMCAGGIYGMPMESSSISISNSYNFGKIDVTAQAIGGIAGVIVGSSGISIYIDTCASLGEIVARSGIDGAIIGGIVGMLQLDSEPTAFEITNSYAYGDVNLQTMAMVGGLVGMLGGDYTAYSAAFINTSAADLTVTSDSSELLAAQGGLYAEMDGAMNVTNSYGIVNGTMTISTETSGMDGNFGYLENFQDGNPVPLGIYYITDYATTTGILDQLNRLA